MLYCSVTSVVFLLRSMCDLGQSFVPNFGGISRHGHAADHLFAIELKEASSLVFDHADLTAGPSRAPPQSLAFPESWRNVGSRRL